MGTARPKGLNVPGRPRTAISAARTATRARSRAGRRRVTATRVVAPGGRLRADHGGWAPARFPDRRSSPRPTRPDRPACRVSVTKFGTRRRQPWLKVSQLLMSPDRYPVVNQSLRCCAVPWVKLSGLTRPCVSCWIRSSPTAAAAFCASAMLSWLRLIPFCRERVGEVRPHPGVAVRLQLQLPPSTCSRATGCAPAPRGPWARCRAASAGGGRTRGPRCTPARTGPGRRTGPAAAAGSPGRSTAPGPAGSRRARWRSCVAAARSGSTR